MDRAAEVGLLTAHGGGYYTIHPALPWFFKGLFDEHWPDRLTATQRGARDAATDVGPQTALPVGSRLNEDAAATGPSEISDLKSAISNLKSDATRAFVEALGELGNYYLAQYDDGNRDVIAALAAEEANLRVRRFSQSELTPNARGTPDGFSFPPARELPGWADRTSPP